MGEGVVAGDIRGEGVGGGAFVEEGGSPLGDECPGRHARDLKGILAEEQAAADRLFGRASRKTKGGGLDTIVETADQGSALQAANGCSRLARPTRSRNLVCFNDLYPRLRGRCVWRARYSYQDSA